MRDIEDRDMMLERGEIYEIYDMERGEREEREERGRRDFLPLTGSQMIIIKT